MTVSANSGSSGLCWATCRSWCRAPNDVAGIHRRLSWLLVLATGEMRYNPGDALLLSMALNGLVAVKKVIPHAGVRVWVGAVDGNGEVATRTMGQPVGGGGGRFSI